MKKLLPLLLLVLGFMFTTPISADSLHVTDDAHLFTEEQTLELEHLATTLSQQIKGGIFIYTNQATYDDVEKFADDFLRSKVGNDNNGAVFMVNLKESDYYFSNSGNMMDYLTDKRVRQLGDEIPPYLSKGDYFTAAKQYLEMTANFVRDGVPNHQYHIDRDTGKITYIRTLTPLKIGLALLGAIVVSLGYFFTIKSRYQLKKVDYRYPYTKNATLKLTKHSDALVSSIVTTRHIPKSNSSGGGGGGGTTTHSSGGGTFSGGGGKF